MHRTVVETWDVKGTFFDAHQSLKDRVEALMPIGVFTASLTTGPWGDYEYNLHGNLGIARPAITIELKYSQKDAEQPA